MHYQTIRDDNLPLTAQERSRDIYELSRDSQLVVYSDRLYAGDVCMKDMVPGKGVILNNISMVWTKRFARLAGSHLLTADAARYPENAQPYRARIEHRSVVVRKVKRLPFLFQVVGSLGGELWEEYVQSGGVGGVALPRNLQAGVRMEPAVMIPRIPGESAAEDGRRRAQRLLGPKQYTSVEEVCLSIFGVGRNYAASRGLGIADAYFECGIEKGAVCLLNEVMTPDAATYWPGEVEPGQSPPPFERQNMFNWLAVQRWKPDQPPPDLPAVLVGELAKKYRFVFNVMTGKVKTLKRQEEEAAADDFPSGEASGGEE
jgi:phosphoribosylaminoimidazole-succinocarboxamide synthase